MGGSTHESDALAAFQNGETRLVYARKTDDPAGLLFFLEDGQAAAVKKWAAGHLECFMPECHDRRFKVINRSKGRDGFSHHSGSGGHSPEGLFHQQAKALVLRWVTWLAETNGWTGLTATAEQSTLDGSRRADVMVTGPTGHQVAIEIQYAALSVDEWQTRNSSYLRQGVTPVWLFGHTGAHLKRYRYAWEGHPNPQVAISALHQAVIAAGQQPLWINPITSRIGYGSVLRRSEHDRFRTHVGSSDRFADFADLDIWECSITPAGIELPSNPLLAEAQALFEQAIGRDSEARRQRQERADLNRAWRVEQDRKMRHENARKRKERMAKPRSNPASEMLRKPTPGDVERRARLARARLSDANRAATNIYFCHVCGWALAEEFSHIGGHPGTCIPLSPVPDEDTPPTLFD